MDVTEAVKIAREHAGQVFTGETVRIEEVWFDDMTSEWYVTVGLPRPEPLTGIDLVMGKTAITRMHYKTVRIADDTKQIRSVLNHDKMPVAPR